MTEKAITKKVKDHLDDLKKSGEPIFFFKVHGTAMQKSGIPDVFICYYGIPIFIELKQPGKEATKIQQYRIDEIRKAGGVAEVCHSEEGVTRILRQIKIEHCVQNATRY